ncbi:hypothetical protein [Motilibacter deserti]|uniref:Dolichyl-phosphate-mannose-protein mannosyltransferase n=1 Tax=Motilibacter deserti TaxID=2714956 RepID=A0ABX0GVC3_9ACTN|nr:hypothetical protein [Motilibacter deserti]NHC14869.1 hypothetical protein [Motilibacter deserti]
MDGALVRRGGPVAAVVLVALVVRLVVLRTPLAALNGDEAVVGLMAERIGDGHLYAFFAGQGYMGALEQYAQAAVVAVRPGDPFALRLTTALLSSAAAGLVLVVGRLLLRSERRAVTAAAVYAVGPAFNVLDGVTTLGAYADALVVGLIGLWAALRPGAPTARRSAALGLCCGAGLWLTPVAAFLLLPAGVWFVGALRGLGRRRSALLVSVAAAAAVLGSLPMWLWAAAERRVPLLGSEPPVHASLLDRFAGLVDSTLPEAAGLAWIGPSSVLPRPVLVAFSAAVLLAGAVLAWRRRTSLLQTVLLRSEGRDPRDLLLVALVLGTLLYVASPFTWYAASPRYLFPATPWLVWALAAALPARRGVPAVAVAAVAAVSWATLASAQQGRPASWTSDLRETMSWLRGQGVEGVYADYRSAHTLDFVDRADAPPVVPFEGVPCRFPELDRAVAAAGRVAYVSSPAKREALERALTQRRVPVAARHSTATLEAFVVDGTAPVPWRLGLEPRPWCAGS